MSSNNDPSLDDLRARAELSRAALAANVTELRGRIARVSSPAAIKAEVRTYARHEREGLVDRLRQRAAENPLQAAAVAAAIAYPALSIVRAIPMPLMLIGAGLFLTTKRGQDSAATMQAKMNDAVRQGTETVTAMAEPVTSRVSEKVSSLREQAAATIGAASTTIGAASAAVAGSVSAAASAADPAKLRAGVEGASARLANMASDAAHSVSAQASRAGGSASRFVSDNAILIAGVGAIAGALLAASFPLSETENRVLGPGKRKVKDAARAAAAMGMDKAGAVVADTIESVKSAAAREGLDGTGLQETVGDLADKARAVAERTVDAALGHEIGQQQEQQTFSERNPT
jgi:hypothetical protein